MYKECVYVLLDSRKSGVFSYEDLIFNNEPFYVGKGSPERPYNGWSFTSKTLKDISLGILGQVKLGASL